MRLKDSYFQDCDRDDQGHCKPGSGGGGASGEKPGGSKPADKPTAADKPAQSVAQAHGLLHKLGSTSWDALKAAGAKVSQVEHCAKEWVKSGAEKAVAKLPASMQPLVKGVWTAVRLGTKTAFATYGAGQSLAERVAKQRGATPEQAARLRAVLSVIDVMTAKPVTIGLAAVGLGAISLPASMIPAGSMAYLAYSGSLEGAKAARTQAKALVAKMRGTKGYDAMGDLTGDLLDALKSDEDMALYLALLDLTGDAREALLAMQGRGMGSLDVEKPSVAPF